jgi:tripartite-type tricarboxylate transporter receptor subunit TctC
MIMNKKGVFGAVMAVTGALLLSPTIASAKVSYEGKTIKIVIPYGPGGTYDKYGQTFADHLGKHIPGNPTVIVQHMPGAGGVKAMNWTFAAAPKDGFTLIVPLDNSVVNQLMRPKKMRFDARKFRWLGSSNQTNIVLVVRSDTGVRKWQDMRKKQIIGGATGLAATGYIMPGLLKSVLGLNFKMVTGYKGSSKTIHSVEQGETQMAAYNWLAWSSKVPQWFKGEKPFARAVLQMGVFKDPDLPASVPMVSTLVSNDMDRKAVDFIKVLGLLGRGLALPPGVPEDAVTTLRTAYDKMNADPVFAASLKKRRLRLIPSTGAQIEKIVANALDNATPAVVAHARNLIYGKKK